MLGITEYTWTQWAVQWYLAERGGEEGVLDLVSLARGGHVESLEFVRFDSALKESDPFAVQSRLRLRSLHQCRWLAKRCRQ